MSSSPQIEIQRILKKACELPEKDRAAFLFEQSAGDWKLYEQLTDAWSTLDHGHGDEPANAPHPNQSDPQSRYKILEVLGEGAMAIVYLAEQTEPIRRRVALKVAKIGSAWETTSSRFEVERHALAMMNHPNIATIYDTNEAPDGRYYFTLEYISGRKISEYCDSARLSIRGRLELFLDVCSAIEHAHQKGIIHRDLKPTNILMREDSDPPTPKVIDFGVAKAIGDNLAEKKFLTLTRSIVGTIEYMSPEQASGESSAVDSRTDVYSLGVVLHELLTGHLPIEIKRDGSSPYASARQAILDLVPPLMSRRIQRENQESRELKARERGVSSSEHSSGLAGDLDWIVRKAIEKDPDNRYGSASEFAHDIRNYLDGQPVVAGPPGRLYRMKRFSKQNRKLVKWTGVVTLAFVVGIILNLYFVRENRRARHEAERQSQKILQLSSATHLANSTAASEKLYPPDPRMILAMESWLSGPAHELVEAMPGHIRALHDMEKTMREEDVLAHGEADLETQFEYDLLRSLVADLELFADPDPHIGLVANVKARLAYAHTVNQETVLQYGEAWGDAIESIADKSECPFYNGLRIEPQVGLIPVGRDPVTGFWEFVHHRTGTIPNRDSNNRLQLTDSTGVVLILLPGSCFVMGADPDFELLAQYVPDGVYSEVELPAHEVCLDPFFFSKFEMTRRQWFRISGTWSREGSSGGANPPADREPASDVTWVDAESKLRHWGLRLPTEAQWEYAAKAGTDSPWWTGWDPTTIRQRENLLGVYAAVSGVGGATDTYPGIAPVGTFDANPFGLHDTGGNIIEWCLDSWLRYSQPVRKGDGLREGNSDKKVVRGGGSGGHPWAARSGTRKQAWLTLVNGIGFRPARPVEVYASDSEEYHER